MNNEQNAGLVIDQSASSSDHCSCGAGCTCGPDCACNTSSRCAPDCDCN